MALDQDQQDLRDLQDLQELQVLQSQLKELRASRMRKPPSEPSFGDRLDRGANLLQSTAGAAAQSVGEATGLEGLASFGEEVKLRNRAEAEQAAPAGRDLFGDNLLGAISDLVPEMLPSLGAIGAGAASGAALGSFAGPGGAAIGGLAGLGLTALGMNVGTVKEIEEGLDPESESSLGSLFVASAATVPDLLTGGAVLQSGKAAAKSALLKEISARTAKDTGIGVAAGTVSQGVLEAGGTLTTGTEFSEDRVDAMARNVATSALMNGLGTAPVSAISQAGGSLVRRQEAHDLANSPFQFDGEGNTVWHEANPMAYATDDAYRDGLAAIGMGRPVDVMNKQWSGNRSVREFGRLFDTAFDERPREAGRTRTDVLEDGTTVRVKQGTINSEAALLKTDAMAEMDMFTLSNMSRKEQAQVELDKANGVETPATMALRRMEKMMLRDFRAAGMKVGDLGPNYVPVHMSYKKIKDNPQSLIDLAVKHGHKKEDVEVYVRDVIAQGEERFGDSVAQASWAEEAIKDPRLLKKTVRQLESKFAGKLGTVRTTNNLEMNRFLSKVPQNELAEWTVDMPLSEKYDLYLQKASSRLAFAKTMGAKGEKVHEAVHAAMKEASDKGEIITPASVKSMYDLADLQQHITGQREVQYNRQLTQRVKDVVNGLVLPLSLTKQLAEPIFMLPKVGPKAFVTGGLKGIQAAAAKGARKVWKGIPQSDHEKFLAQTDVNMKQAARNVAARVNEDTATPGGFTTWLMKWNGVTGWTELTRGWSALAARDAFIDEVTRLDNHSLSKTARRNAGQRLLEAGLDPVKARDWVAKGATDSHPYHREIRRAAMMITDDVIFNPSPVNKPAWTSHPSFWLQMLSHLKTFPLQFNTKVITPVYKTAARGDNGPVVWAQLHAKTAAMSALATAAYVGVDAISIASRDGSLDRFEDKDAGDLLLASGQLMGGPNFFLDPLAAGTTQRSAAMSLAGPAIGKASGAVENVGRLLFQEDYSPEDALDDIIRGLPNIAGSREVLLEAVD